MHAIVIEVPNDKVGLVIGKGGSTIKELESRTGGHVQITPDSMWAGKAVPRPILLKGTETQLAWLKQLVSERVNIPPEELISQQEFTAGPIGSAPAGAQPGWGNVNRRQEMTANQSADNVVHIATDAVGLIIGRAGATIRELESQHSIKIHIAKECAPGMMNMRAITITGDSPDSIEGGKQAVLSKVPEHPCTCAPRPAHTRTPPPSFPQLLTRTPGRHGTPDPCPDAAGCMRTTTLWPGLPSSAWRRLRGSGGVIFSRLTLDVANVSLTAGAR